MAHVIYRIGAQTFAKVTLPRSDTPAAVQAADMLDAGRLPFVTGTPYVAIDDAHPAAGLSISRLAVDFEAGTVSVLPQTAPVLTELDYAAAIEAHIETVAKAKAYSGAVALASYKDSTVAQWAMEAVAFIAWRDSVWLYAYGLMGAVKAGQGVAPTIPELIASLPVISWPN